MGVPHVALRVADLVANPMSLELTVLALGCKSGCSDLMDFVRGWLAAGELRPRILVVVEVGDTLTLPCARQCATLAFGCHPSAEKPVLSHYNLQIIQVGQWEPSEACLGQLIVVPVE